MKKWLMSATAAAVLATTATLNVANADDDDGMVTYSVTITNITRGQIIAPPAVIAHNSDYHMFTLGQPASAELAQLAENGNSRAVVNAANGMSTVYTAVLGSGPIMPGASQTVEIQTTKRFADITVGAMLATTNDGFMSIQGVHAPKRGSIVVDAVGYDAGSEWNSEDCMYIPGPPCGDTRHNPAGPEGYVHVHAGFHTVDMAQKDWRNPVAQVEIKRVDR